MTSAFATCCRFALVASVTLGFGTGARPRPADLALRAQSWIDVVDGSLRGPSVFLIQGDRIGAIVDAAVFRQLDARRLIDLGTATVLPGLIDAHVHLQLGGSIETNASATLDAGFTTAVDLGATNGDVLRLRDGIASGAVRGPRLLAAGLWAGTKDGVCEFGGIGIADGPAGFRRRVRDNVGAGADVIKVCVSGWPARAFVQPEAYEIAAPSLAALVDDSHTRGKMVIAHAISAGAVRASLDAGVDGLAHAAFVDGDDIAAMRSKRTFMISTLASLLPATPADARVALAAAVRAAHAGGVTLVYGTDAGVIPHGHNAREFAALVDAGLAPADGLRAATIDASAAFHLPESGELRQGYAADIIAVTGDPLRDPAALSRVVFVMKQGRVVKSALPALAPIQAPAARRQEPGSAERRLAAIQQELMRAWIDRDRAALEAFLAPDWFVTGPAGVISSRSQVLDDVFVRRIHQVLTGAITDVSVRMVGADAAVVSGITKATGTSAGAPYTADIRFTDVFERHGNQWRAVRSHASSIGK